MTTYIRETTILGGLPVFAKVSFSADGFTGEGWAEVEEIYWRKGNRPGKPIPQAVFDRAERYDPYFGALTDHISEQIAWEHDNDDRRDENCSP